MNRDSSSLKKQQKHCKKKHEVNVGVVETRRGVNNVYAGRWRGERRAREGKEGTNRRKETEEHRGETGRREGKETEREEGRGKRALHLNQYLF